MTPPDLWIRVPPPTFDLVGVVLSSLTLAGLLAALTLLLGALLGAFLIVRGRRRAPEPPPFFGLNAPAPSR